MTTGPYVYSEKKMVGVKGFEPPTPCSQSTCATKLRYTPSGTIVSVFSRALVSSTSCIIQERARFVNRFFTLFCAFFAPFFVKRSNHSQYLHYLFISHIHISFCSLHIAFLLHVFCRISLRVHAFNRLNPFSLPLNLHKARHFCPLEHFYAVPCSQKGIRKFLCIFLCYHVK